MRIIKHFRNRIKKYLDKGDEIPEWFSYPEVAKELKNPDLHWVKRVYHILQGFLFWKIHNCKWATDKISGRG